MATAILWTNVQVSIQSAIAAADTITGITKANPGVVTSTGHGWADGDYVYYNVEGMYQLDERIVRVDNVTANTAELEGLDTTNFETFSSGAGQVVTFGTSVTTAVGISGSGGDFEFADVTTIHDAARKQIPSFSSALTFTFDMIFDPADAALAALKAASDLKAKRAMKITWSTGAIMVLNGYVGASLTPTGSAGELVKTSVVFTAFGSPTYYAS
ncbi:MAG: phage tail tube protein [Hyphomonadaceae bacterium]